MPPKQPIGEAVPPVVAQVPTATTLTGRFVRLQMPQPTLEVAALYQATHGNPERDAMWTYLAYGPFADQQAMLAQLQQHAASQDPLFFSVWDQQSEQPVGMVSFLRMEASMGVIELGHIWYTPAAQHTRVNTETIYLMLSHCFEQGFRRVEWKCDALNRPSREAALRLGFSFEGIFRQHMIYKGRNRDTAWFSLLDQEWPEIRANFAAYLYGDGGESLRRLNARVRRYHPG